ncbi:VOC family protein [Virgibacillus halodenitrificans]|uniref:VOC family protein n=1 Tax=Virgibacillus halodenitrificans TaxID=1482 RepID=UPI00136D44B0|nr:VOC family protein [Virgibacillus halodenitrificans]MYL47243.1 VOC family protein [Virgibacillus halodenitrificans]
MNEKLIRVGTIYLPVRHLEEAASWYVAKLGAKINYQDKEKAILELADQSFFLIKAKEEASANFYAANGTECFSLTFEVDGLEELKILHKDLKQKAVQVGDIEDRGHTGRNFVFADLDGNKFDVWSELSPTFKQRMKE